MQLALSTMELRHGSSTAVLSTIGNQLVPFYGYMENVLSFSTFASSPPLMVPVLQQVQAKPFLRMLFPNRSILRFIFLSSSAIIEDIKTMYKAGLASFAYFYFDFKDSSKRDIRNLLSSTLAQLCDQSNHSWTILSRLYTTHRDGSDEPSEAALTRCLQDILNVQGQPPTYIIVDAVDECPNTPGIPSPREKVLTLVEDLVNSHAALRICVTSRPEQDIRTVLEPLTPRHISLHDESGQKDDIINYVRFVVHSDRTMGRWRAEDKELVIYTLTERANGM